MKMKKSYPTPDDKFEERDITLLKASIVHWKKDNVNQTDPFDMKLSVKECALCFAYHKKRGRCFCEGCPIYWETGTICCYHTPYCDVTELQDRWMRSTNLIKPKGMEKAVKKEIKFLEKLLKKAEKQLAKK